MLVKVLKRFDIFISGSGGGIRHRRPFVEQTSKGALHMASKNLKIAFIGTGIMGAPIAGHIMDAGYELTVYNRTKEKACLLYTSRCV